MSNSNFETSAGGGGFSKTKVDFLDNVRAMHWTVQANGVRWGKRQLAWSYSMGKRAFDLLVVIPGMFVCLPLIVITAILVKLTSKGPILFTQQRVGRDGVLFTIYKFRTMDVEGCGYGPLVTKDGDGRLTSVGRWLRRLKLDELPQLLNVLKGDMSFVGPRPKVLSHQRQPPKFRPGLTGAASLVFRKEEILLKHIPDRYLDAVQVDVMMPIKARLDSEYMESATLRSDLVLLARTLLLADPSESKSHLKEALDKAAEYLAENGNANRTGGKRLTRAASA
jgi:lipopolysaccharide/colanic/teichoic acid biosynthesis glycosyltransferase